MSRRGLRSSRPHINHQRTWRPSLASAALRPAVVHGARRHASTLEAGEGKSGHIRARPNQGIFFFDTVFPLRLRWLYQLPFSDARFKSLTAQLERPTTLAGVDPTDVIAKSKLDDAGVRVTDVLPRFKEGGAFVKFTHKEGVALGDVEKAVQAYLREVRPRPWWSPWSRMRASLVRGKPWLEDLFRLPSTRLRVEFLACKPGEAAAELTEEELYGYFRPYGKLTDIVPQPSDSKVVPRYAYVDFTTLRRSIMAKNCLHGYVVGEAEGGGTTGTVLKLSFETREKTHWIRDWLFSHPRLVIPALIAIAGAITVAVFDPIRTWFIKAHVCGTLHLSNNRVWQWIATAASSLFPFRRKRDDDADTRMAAIWDERKDHIEQMRAWLAETADTFIVVQGPRGSGKRALVLDQALKDRRVKLFIDCKPIQEARGDSATIKAAAAEVGYRPVFSWMNRISGMIDVAAQGAAGVKTGFSETLDSQLAKIWNNTATALREIALQGRKKTDKDAHLSDDEYLDAHPEQLPVVVIDNFLHKAQEGSVVYDKIAEWAARLTTANIAHVVFLTHDVSFSKSLSKALPDRVFRQLSLGDCSRAAARRFVLSHLSASDTTASASASASGQQKSARDDDAQQQQDLEASLDALGGRLTDLESLARRIKTGETPRRAVAQMIQQSAAEILKMHLFSAPTTTSPSSSEEDGERRNWSPAQAWLLVRAIAAHDHPLRYNAVALDPLFGPGAAAADRVLAALERAELIAIAERAGRPFAVGPAKPVLRPAFRALCADEVLAARMDLAVLDARVKREEGAIARCEEELRVLGALPGVSGELAGRVRWLLGNVRAGQERIEGWEGERRALEARVRVEW